MIINNMKIMSAIYPDIKTKQIHIEGGNTMLLTRWMMDDRCNTQSIILTT